MAYLACDKDGTEIIFAERPRRFRSVWIEREKTKNKYVELPKGLIAKLIGRELTWSDEPVMIE